MAKHDLSLAPTLPDQSVTKGYVDAGLAVTMTGRLSHTGDTNLITDWDTALETGWYAGYNAAHAPPLGGWLMGTVEALNTTGNEWATQTLQPFGSGEVANNTMMYRRERTGASWGLWYKLQWSQAEQDVRYAPVLLGNTLVSTGGVLVGTYDAAKPMKTWTFNRTFTTDVNADSIVLTAAQIGSGCVLGATLHGASVYNLSFTFRNTNGNLTARIWNSNALLLSGGAIAAGVVIGQ